MFWINTVFFLYGVALYIVGRATVLTGLCIIANALAMVLSPHTKKGNKYNE